jgi:hypothetical protein
MAKTVAVGTITHRILIFLIDYLLLQLYMHFTWAGFLWFYFYGSRATSYERRKKGGLHLYRISFHSILFRLQPLMWELGTVLINDKSCY